MATRQRIYPLQNGQFGWKNKIVQDMRKTTLKSHNIWSIQKTDGKKIAIDIGKGTLQWNNGCSIQKTDRKTANIREIRGFWKLAKMVTRQTL